MGFERGTQGGRVPEGRIIEAEESIPRSLSRSELAW